MRAPPDDPIAHRLARAQAAARLFGGSPEVVRVGRYEVRRWLGAGASGVVYAAWDPNLEREIALKVLRAGRAQDQVFAEARALARLSHPGVVTVHDVGVHEAYVFVTMARVDGPNLREWCRDQSVAEVVHAWLDVGRALAAAHAEGIVHRDVKPDNVVVGTKGRVTLVDFGLARTAGTPAQATGTPAYMAPEQRRGEQAQAASDQYAFAVAMAETLGPRLPPRLGRVLARAGAESAHDRYATMEDLLHALTDDPTGRALRTTMAAVLAVFTVIALVGAVLQMVMFSRAMWGS
ncbi:MAG: serine/threonine-protein kinase [Myxococcota bacterium]